MTVQKKKSTLEDVAKLAGVSTATISRCLNDPEKVRENLREKIHKSIEQLGYVPHGAARALASSRTKTIGIIVPTIDNLIFAEAIQQLQIILTKKDYTLLLASSMYSLNEELDEVHSLLSRGIDGLVLIGEEHHPEVISSIEKLEIPYVNLWTYHSTSKHSCIGIDHIKAGKKIAEHFVSLGHTQFGFISGYLNHNDRAFQRLDGVKRGLKEQSIDLKQENIIECKYSMKHGKQAFEKLISSNPSITAIICGNDVLALGALNAARELSIRIPHDVSISGFDNIDIISALPFSITTIDVPAKKMGEEAANFILNEIKQGSKSMKRLELNAELVVGETTGPAKK